MSIKFAKISTYKPGKNEEKHRREIDQDLSKLFQALTPAFGTGGVSPGGSNTNVQYNKDGGFGGDAGFIYNTLVSVAIKKDMKFIYDNDESADTYVKYNSTTDYLEFYVDGEIRLQM